MKNNLLNTEMKVGVLMQRMRVGGVMLLIIASLFLAGCGTWIQYLYTDEMCEDIAKKALQERFGEEFEVRSMYTDYWRHFYAVCTPEKHEDIVFTAKIGKNGELYSEDYFESIIGKQIKNYISYDIEELWPGTYVHIEKSDIKDKNKYDGSYYSITLEDYMRSTNDTGFAIADVYIPISISNKVSIEKEYYFWQEEIGEKIRDREIPRLSFRVWFLNDQIMKQIPAFYKEDEYKRVENLVGEPNYHFGYDDDYNMILTYEEYKERRLTNE